jgi:hypothetical protein
MPLPASFLSVLLAAATVQVPSPHPNAAAHPALATTRAPRFERVYPLSANEGVFAYSRISPDGNVLAYASETRGGRQRTIRVVDLRTREVVFTEPGIDAYWSTDGTRMIWLSQAGGRT